MRANTLKKKTKGPDGQGRQAVIKHILLPEDLVRDLQTLKDCYNKCLSYEKNGKTVSHRITYEQMLRRWIDLLGRFDPDVDRMFKDIKKETTPMNLKVTESRDPQTPYISDFSAEILTADGKLAGKRSYSLIKVQEMIDDEVGIAENILSTTDFGYLKMVFGEDFIFGRGGTDTGLTEILDKNDNYNVLVLKCLEILPEYRGMGYGRKSEKEVLKMLDGQFGLAIKKASPLQFDRFSLEYDLKWAKRMQFDKLPKDQEAATRTLIQKYESWGFTRINDSTFLYRDPKQND